MLISQQIDPLYIRNYDIPQRNLKAFDICEAMTRHVKAHNIDGAQKIQNVWRLYLKDNKSRADLFMKETMVIAGKPIQIFDQDPAQFPKSRFRQNDKITVKDVPFHISNDQIKEMIESAGAIFASPVKDSYERDEDNNMTSYKNGDRFMYVEPMEEPIKRKLTIGCYTATVIHHGKDNRPCQACNLTGHKVGDEKCPAYPKTPIYAFKSYRNPMSNHYPCDLVLFDEITPFKSWEHGFFWKMAIELGNPHLVANIKNATYAGVAKSLSKKMDEKDRHEWEDDNRETIENLLYEKFKQCEPFRQCLIDNKDKIFAEATSDKRWATGLSPFVSQYTAPEYWPGKNLLGEIITNMAKNVDDLLKKIEEDDTFGSATPSPYDITSPEVDEAIREMEQIEQEEAGREAETCKPLDDSTNTPKPDNKVIDKIECDDTRETETEALDHTKSIDESDKSQSSPRGRPVQRISEIKRSRSTSLKIMKLRDQLPDILFSKKGGKGAFLSFLEKAHDIIQQENVDQKRKQPDSSPDVPAQESKQHNAD